MSDDIKPTDVVTLKSGGFAMTVESVVASVVPNHPAVAELIWMNGAGVMQREGAISVALLTKKETAP